MLHPYLASYPMLLFIVSTNQRLYSPQYVKTTNCRFPSGLYRKCRSEDHQSSLVWEERKHHCLRHFLFTWFRPNQPNQFDSKLFEEVFSLQSSVDHC